MIIVFLLKDAATALTAIVQNQLPSERFVNQINQLYFVTPNTFYIIFNNYKVNWSGEDPALKHIKSSFSADP